jgi:peptide deformylase
MRKALLLFFAVLPAANSPPASFNGWHTTVTKSRCFGATPAVSKLNVDFHLLRFESYCVPVRPIIRFPDPHLRQKAEPILYIDEEVRGLAQDLTETMHAAPGIGITAAHVGVLRRLVVIQLEGAAKPHISINPEIVWVSPERIRHLEGSVSMPGVNDEVERHARVRVRYRDLDDREHEEEAEGLMAVCFQHEIDQLDGIFWIDRLSKLKRDRLIKRFDKLQRTKA